MREKQTNTLPDGSIIDLDSYDWGDFKLNKRQKLFCIWYATPNQSGFQNPTKAAQKAGYSNGSAFRAKWNLLRDVPDIGKFIKKLTDDCIKVNLEEAAKKLMQQKIARANYNVRDFYEIKEIENPETGEIRTITAVKPINELTQEQAQLIENVEFTNTGIPTYKLPNKEKEINEVIKLSAELNKESASDDFDIETTVDLVKENLASIKTTIRLNNQKVRENAENYIESNENQPEFD